MLTLGYQPIITPSSSPALDSQVLVDYSSNHPLAKSGRDDRSCSPITSGDLGLKNTAAQDPMSTCLLTGQPVTDPSIPTGFSLTGFTGSSNQLPFLAPAFFYEIIAQSDCLIFKSSRCQGMWRKALKFLPYLGVFRDRLTRC